MGCCKSKNKHAASETTISKFPRSSSKEGRNVVIQFDEEDVIQPISAERPSITGGDNKLNVGCLVLEVLDVVRKLTERLVYKQRKSLIYI